MKKFTFLLGFSIITSLGFSQVIVDLLSVPCNPSLEGTYDYELADLDGSATDWNSPDMTQSGNSVQAELVLVDDGTTPGTFVTPGDLTYESIHDACETGTWTQDLTGKIAVLYRGACEFGCKAENAQSRGAVAVIIINHTGDAVGMAGGTCGPNVNIPVVMLGADDGAAIASCLSTSGTGVVGFIGTKVGLHPYDMGTSIGDFLMAKSTSNPIAISIDSTELNIDCGLWAYNYGTNMSTNVTASVDIVYNGSTTVYSKTSNPVTFAAVSGNIVDTQYIDLGNFGQTPWQVGTYTMTYTISAPDGDEDLADNTFSVDFKVTSDNSYAKGRTDVTNAPIFSTAYSLNESSILYDDWEACIQFRNPNASRLKAFGMTFSCQPVGQTMSNEIIEIRAYEWNDSFTDLNDANYEAIDGGIWNLNQVGSGLYFYLDESEDATNVYLPFDSPVDLNNNQRYMFCLYNASDSLRIGYDSQLNYFATVNNYLQWTTGLKVLSNGGSEEWYGNNGFGYDAVPAITVDLDYGIGIENISNEESFVPYPNPAVNSLNIPLRKKNQGNVQIQLFDIAGKEVLNEKQIIADETLRINVASIANGNYVLKMLFENGTQDSYKISINR